MTSAVSSRDRCAPPPDRPCVAAPQDVRRSSRRSRGEPMPPGLAVSGRHRGRAGPGARLGEAIEYGGESATQPATPQNRRTHGSPRPGRRNGPQPRHGARLPLLDGDRSVSRPGRRSAACNRGRRCRDLSAAAPGAGLDSQVRAGVDRDRGAPLPRHRGRRHLVLQPPGPRSVGDQQRGAQAGAGGADHRQVYQGRREPR